MLVLNIFKIFLRRVATRNMNMKKIKELEGQMRAAVQQAEDMLELNIVEIMSEQYHQQEPT